MTEPATPFASRLPWVIAVLAVVALVANLVWTRTRDATPDPAVAELAARLDAMDGGGAGAAGARRPQGGAGRPAGSTGGNGLGAGDDPARAQRTPEQLAAERDRQMRELEAQFARDAADPVGGPRTENTLVETISGDTMAGTGLRPSDVDIACKRSSCRIVGTFDRIGDAQDWSLFYITAAGGNVLSQTQMVFVPLPDGRHEVRIYSARAR